MNYREPAEQPELEVLTTLVIRRELALDTKGNPRYTVVNIFDGPDHRMFADVWLRGLVSNLTWKAKKTGEKVPAFLLLSPSECYSLGTVRF